MFPLGTLRAVVPGMTIRATITSATPKKTAMIFQAVLAADKGFTSELQPVRHGYLVVASDGQAVMFERQVPGTQPWEE